MITQQTNANRCARAFYFDGHENVLATSDIGLSPFDLDELNVCHTLDNPLVPGGPPEAGLVVFAFTDHATPGRRRSRSGRRRAATSGART